MAERRCDSGVDGEEGADRDQRHLRLLTDLHPEDEERHPGQGRDRTDCRERRAEQHVAYPREPDDPRDREADH